MTDEELDKIYQDIINEENFKDNIKLLKKE